jgi:hypothetical protein
LLFGRSIIAGVVTLGFLWMVALSVSPELHASVHGHASDMTHHCGATLLAAGQCEDAPLDAPLATLALLAAPTAVRVVTPAVLAPCLGVSVLEHAPPFAA